ncbi:Hexosyltransferase [Aphelenchoides besseyi]|nr:Hexosyltransferase [Aphelenchoides besseyi]
MFGEAVKFEMKFANFNLTYEMKQPKIEDKPSDYRVLFIVGRREDSALNKLLDEEQRQFGDVIRYSAEDKYELLHVKVHAAFSWQQKFCPQARYLLKTDDDTVVDLSRMNYFVQSEFNALLKNYPKSFICNRWGGKRPLRDPSICQQKEYNGTIFPTFCQGCSYLASTAAIGTLLNHTSNLNIIHLEDVLFTGLVAENSPGIYHHSSAAFEIKVGSSIELRQQEFQRKHKCDKNNVPYPCAYIGIPSSKLAVEYEQLKNLKC